MTILDGADVVFHLAAEPGVRSSWGDRFERYARNNVLATQQVLRAVAERNDVRVVYASSSSIYGDAESFPTREDALPAPYSPYGLTKLSGEHLCNVYHRNFGVDVVSLRYFTVFGPRQRPDMAFNIFCERALTGEPITIYGDGYQTRDFTFVGDIVAATQAAGQARVGSGTAYNVGGGLNASIRDVLDTITDLVGQPLNVTYGQAVAGDVRNTGADTTRARTDLSFSPQTNLRDGLELELDWMRERLSATEPTARRDRAQAG